MKIQFASDQIRIHRRKFPQVRIRENSPDARWLTRDDLKHYFDEGEYLTRIPRVDDGRAGLEREYGQTLRKMIGVRLDMENLS